MTEEDFNIFLEVTSSAAPLSALHPLKLDKWHRALVDVPPPLYMQLGVGEIFQQVDQGARAIQAIINILGRDHLPLEHTEIARRHIGKFVLHVPHGESTAAFSLSWDKPTSKWFAILDLEEVGGRVSAESLEEAVELAMNWELPSSSTEDEESSTNPTEEA
jgi:hypothetical protein